MSIIIDKYFLLWYIMVVKDKSTIKGDTEYDRETNPLFKTKRNDL